MLKIFSQLIKDYNYFKCLKPKSFLLEFPQNFLMLTDLSEIGNNFRVDFGVNFEFDFGVDIGFFILRFPEFYFYKFFIEKKKLRSICSNRDGFFRVDCSKLLSFRLCFLFNNLEG